jgi:hypothetical protein
MFQKRKKEPENMGIPERNENDRGFVEDIPDDEDAPFQVEIEESMARLFPMPISVSVKYKRKKNNVNNKIGRLMRAPARILHQKSIQLTITYLGRQLPNQLRIKSKICFNNFAKAKILMMTVLKQ